MALVLMGLIHTGCGGMVAPLFDPSIDEAELRALVGDAAYCMRCGEATPGALLEGEFVEWYGGEETVTVRAMSIDLDPLVENVIQTDV